MCVCVCVHHASHGLLLNVFSTRTPYRSTNAQEEVSNRPIDRQAEGEIIIIYCTLFLPVLDGKKKKKFHFSFFEHAQNASQTPERRTTTSRLPSHYPLTSIAYDHQI